MINPNNFDGATVTIVGRAGSEAGHPAWDKEQTSAVREIRVAVSQGFKDKNSGEWKDTGTAWYTVSAAGEYAKDLEAVGKGDKVRIDEGKLEAREFERKDGTKGQEFSITYGKLSIIESKSGNTAVDNVEPPW